MMCNKGLLAVFALFIAASTAGAEQQRATLTHENKYPELYHGDVGLAISSYDAESEEVFATELEARFAVYENFIARAEIPYLSIDNKIMNDTQEGVGDITLGLDLLAYEDIFDYPYIIPHVDVALATGDEDKGLGNGDPVYTVGISLGSVTWDMVTWVVDISYINGTTDSAAEDDDFFQVSGSIIWDVSDRFAFIGEGRAAEQQNGGDTAYVIKGGFAYDVSEALQLAAYAGRASNDNSVFDEDQDFGEFSLSVSF